MVAGVLLADACGVALESHRCCVCLVSTFATVCVVYVVKRKSRLVVGLVFLCYVMQKPDA